MNPFQGHNLEKCSVIWHVVSSGATTHLNQGYRARLLGSFVYELTKRHSGFTSKSLCIFDEGEWKRNTRLKKTNEHYHSRQRTAVELITMVRDGATFEEMCQFLYKTSACHHVSPEENHRLAQIQNCDQYKDKTWKEQYEIAGIELVPCEKTIRYA